VGSSETSESYHSATSKLPALRCALGPFRVTAHRAASFSVPFYTEWGSARRIAFHLCYEFTHHILKNLMEDFFFLLYKLLLCLAEETCMFCRDRSAVQKWCQNVILRCEFMVSDQNSVQIFPDIISDLRSFKTAKRIEKVTVLMCMPNFNLKDESATRLRWWKIIAGGY